MNNENETFRLTEGAILNYCLEDFGIEVSASPVMMNAVANHFMEEMVKCGYIAKNEDMKDVSIDDLGMSVRLHNILARSGIRTVGDLQGMTREGCMNIRTMGRHSFEELERIMKDRCIKFKCIGEVCE